MATRAPAPPQPPSAPPLPTRFTVAEFTRSLDAGLFAWVGDHDAELVHGEVVASPYVRRVHSLITRTVFLALHAYVSPRALGDAFGDGTCYALPHRDDTIRCPNGSFVAAGRLPPGPLTNGWFELAPDLAVEVLSDDERRRALAGKLDDYLAAGTRLIWVVDPRRWGVEVHRADRSAAWVPADAAGEAGVLDGAPVLPGLRLPAGALLAGVARPG